MTTLTRMTPAGKAIPFLVALVFLASSPLIMAETSNPAVSVNCDVHHGACMALLKGATVSLDITPKPVKAMDNLTFTLEVSGRQPDALPFIDLGMPGMKMGPNRVAMQKEKEGLYKGSGVIVRCPSGKRTWKADLTLPGLGAVQFIFDVIY